MDSKQANSYLESVLIDTWWNVNNIHAYIINRMSVVLIDTWWNVNERTLGCHATCLAVLIDTWWNVNYPEALEIMTQL